MRTLAGALLCALLAAPLAAQPEIPDDNAIIVMESGLRYSVLTPGNGDPRPRAFDQVTVHYTGWLTDGTVFDSSRERGQPATFRLDQVIKGWTEGLQQMSVGARFKFTIPPELGYGERARPKIPANSTLIFDVELLKITPGQAPPPKPEWVDATPEAQKTTESGIRYEVLAEGKGEPLGKADVPFQMNFAIWTPRKELFYHSPQPLKGTTQRMNVAVLKEMPLLMKEGMRLRCVVPSALALGSRAQAPVRPGEDTIWVLTMEKIMSPLPLPEFAKTAPDAGTKTDSGLLYEVLKQGSGEKPTRANRVRVHYAGWLEDGTLFDSSYGRGEPTEFGVGQVIQGWQEGLQLMPVGSTFRFTIPANLAYGERGVPGIPGGATLIFHVELLDILN